LHCPGTAGGWPGGTGAHRPGESGRLQRWQVPSQALLQQTPSTQKPDWQAAAQLQAAPAGNLSTGGVAHACGISRT
jgi:hypothetical protein